MGVSEEDRASKFASMEESLPDCYTELVRIKNIVDFLQTRVGKRTAAAAAKIAVDMVDEGLIDKKEAVMRMDGKQVTQLLLPSFKAGAARTLIAKGLPASPGAAVGQIVFTAADAESWKKEGKKTIMVRQETSPEDLP